MKLVEEHLVYHGDGTFVDVRLYEVQVDKNVSILIRAKNKTEAKKFLKQIKVMKHEKRSGKSS